MGKGTTEEEIEEILKAIEQMRKEIKEGFEENNKEVKNYKK